VSHPFEYQRPTDVQAKTMRLVSERLSWAFDIMVGQVAPSAERTLALRKLQEARMWINVAILGIELPR
jgi:hypothetical protein